MKIQEMPEILPFKVDVENVHDDYLVLSYHVQDVSDIITIAGESVSGEMVEAFDRSHSTITIGAISIGWIVQVTSSSVKALKSLSSPNFEEEWVLPTHGQEVGSAFVCQRIMHAALADDGAAIATGTVMYKVQIDTTGKPYTSATCIRSHEVSAIGVSCLEISCANSSACESVPYKQHQRKYQDSIVIVGQWSSNSIHLLSWHDLVELTSIEPGLAPVRSVAIAKLEDVHYLLAGIIDGTLLCSEISVASKQKLSSSMCAAPQRPQLCIQNGKCVTIGRSAVSLKCESSCMPNSRKSRISVGEQQDFIYAQSTNEAVVLLKSDGNLQAVGVHGLRYHPGSLCSVAASSDSLVFLSRDGKLCHGHLDLSIQLRWDALKISGSPTKIAYHKKSGCVIISCLEQNNAQLLFIHVECWCQVLCVALEDGLHPIALSVMQLPTTYKDSSPQNCIVLASKGIENSKGVIHFLEFVHFSPGEQRIRYELHLLSRHSTENPCQSICILNDGKNNKICSGFDASNLTSNDMEM